MARRYHRPTRKELQGGLLLSLTAMDIGSGELSPAHKRNIKRCLKGGITLKTVSEMLGRSPQEIERELEGVDDGTI